MIMAFQVVHCNKIKTPTHLANLLRNAPNGTHGKEPDCAPDNLRGVGQTYAEAWAAREEALKGLTRKPQKNAAAAMEILVSAGEGFSGDWKAYFQDALEFLAKKFGRENLIAATASADKTTPFLRAFFVPIVNTAKGRTYSSSNFFGGRKGLARLQTEFARFVGNKHGLERGIEGSRAKHTDLQGWRRQMVLAKQTRKDFDDFINELTKRTSKAFTAVKRLQTAERMSDAERIKLAGELALHFEFIQNKCDEIGAALRKLERISFKKNAVQTKEALDEM